MQMFLGLREVSPRDLFAVCRHSWDVAARCRAVYGDLEFQWNSSFHIKYLPSRRGHSNHFESPRCGSRFGVKNTPGFPLTLTVKAIHLMQFQLFSRAVSNKVAKKKNAQQFQQVFHQGNRLDHKRQMRNDATVRSNKFVARWRLFLFPRYLG